MTENEPFNEDPSIDAEEREEKQEFLIDSDNNRHVPEIIHEVEWNFRFERDDWLRSTDSPDEDAEWPYWRIDTRLLNADAYVRMYRIRSTHPKTRTVRYDVVSQNNLLGEYERVDSQQVREASLEFPDPD